MGESFVHHVTVALLSFLLGAFFSLIYDGVRILRLFLGIQNRNVFKKIWRIEISRYVEEKRIGRVYESIVMIFTDLFFFFIISVIMAIFVHISNSGIVRWYIYVMATLGFISYYKTVGKVVMSLSVLIVYYVKRAVLSALRTLLYPINRIRTKISNKRKEKAISKKEKEEKSSRKILLHMGK